MHRISPKLFSGESGESVGNEVRNFVDVSRFAMAIAAMYLHKVRIRAKRMLEKITAACRRLRCGLLSGLAFFRSLFQRQLDFYQALSRKIRHIVAEHVIPTIKSTKLRRPMP